MKTQVGTFTVGGRVVEDLLERLGRDQFYLLGSVRGQSLISSYAPARDTPLSPDGDVSQVVEDFRSSLLPELARFAEKIRLLLWDLTDETFGVLIADGSATTRTPTTIEHPELEPSGSRFVCFGSDEHFELWRSAVERFSADLEILGIKDKVLVLSTPWADRDIRGKAVGPSWSRGVDEVNRNLERYRSVLLEVGLATDDSPASIVRAEDALNGEEAPFIYSVPLLDHLKRQVVRIVDPPPVRGKYGWDSLVDPWVDSLAVKADKIPSAYRIWQSARRYYVAGDLERAEHCVQLNKILHNSFVPAELQLGSEVLFGYGGMGVVIHKDALIGEGVTIAPQVTIGGNGSPVRFDPVTQKRSTVPKIDPYAVLSGGARILGGVTIGAFAIVAPNSVVGTDVPPGGIFGGAPARQIGQVTDKNALRYKAKYLPLRQVSEERYMDLFLKHFHDEDAAN